MARGRRSPQPLSCPRHPDASARRPGGEPSTGPRPTAVPLLRGPVPKGPEVSTNYVSRMCALNTNIFFFLLFLFLQNLAFEGGAFLFDHFSPFSLIGAMLSKPTPGFQLSFNLQI